MAFVLTIFRYLAFLRQMHGNQHLVSLFAGNIAFHEVHMDHERSSPTARKAMFPSKRDTSRGGGPRHLPPEGQIPGGEPDDGRRRWRWLHTFYFFRPPIFSIKKSKKTFPTGTGSKHVFYHIIFKVLVNIF